MTVRQSCVRAQQLAFLWQLRTPRMRIGSLETHPRILFADLDSLSPPATIERLRNLSTANAGGIALWPYVSPT
jgi:hypothetical protein